jgi:N-acetylneuraminate lyase
MYPAFFSPLDEAHRFVPKTAESLMLHLLAAGFDGTYAAGSTGEGLNLRMEDRKALVETLMGVMPSGKKLFVHVGASTIADALELAEHAAKSGAHAISSLPPKGEAREVRAYYETLAEKSALPLILYYFPKVAPLAFPDSQTLIDLCDLPNVLGVKFTDFNLYLLQRLTTRGKLVFNGYDEALGAGLLMGAQGGIGSTYSLFPELYLEIFAAAQRGDWESVRTWQLQVNAVFDVLFNYPFFPALRAVMSFRGFDLGPMVGADLLSRRQTADLLNEISHAMTGDLAVLVRWPTASAV